MGVLQEASARVSVVLCGLFAPLFCFAYPVFPYPWMLLTPRQNCVPAAFRLCSKASLKATSFCSGHDKFPQDKKSDVLRLS